MTNTDIKTRTEQLVAQELRTPQESLELDQSFSAYGFESVDAIGMALAVTKEFGLATEPNLAFDFPTLRLLTAHVEEQLTRGNAPPHETTTNTDTTIADLDAIEELSDDDAHALLRTR
jgi:acyl carrier protein